MFGEFLDVENPGGFYPGCAAHLHPYHRQIKAAIIGINEQMFIVNIL